MPHLSLSCLGPFRVTLDGQPAADFKSSKVRALLAYLAVEADRPHSREVLAALLWPDWPDRDALSNLRYALSNLRTVIGDRTAQPPFLLISRETLQFNGASDSWLDVAAFAQAVELDSDDPASLAQLEEAVDWYGGEFLEGFSIADSPQFEEWMRFARDRFAQQASSVLHRLSAVYEQRGSHQRAVTFARRQVELQPWNESAHQQLMRTLALNGQRSAALSQYKTCCRLLAEELGVEPGPETASLYEQIRGGEVKIARPMATPQRSDPAVELPLFLREIEPSHIEHPVFVSREKELAQLESFLDDALAGQGRVVFVTGDAGSGKSALIQEVARRSLSAHPELVFAGGQGNAHTGVGDPYLPFREVLGLLSGDVQAQWAAGAMTRGQAQRLWCLLPLTIQALSQTGPELIDTLLPGSPLLERARAACPWPSKPDWFSSLEDLVVSRSDSLRVPILKQSALFEQYTQVLRGLAARHPLLLAVDDLQWADSGSLNMLFHLGRRIAGSRILLVGAYRPAELALGRQFSLALGQMAERGVGETRERHPLEPIVNEFKRLFGDIEVDLETTQGRAFVDALLDSEPNRLGEAFREALYRHTRGHPLFTIELLRGMQERGDLVQDGEGRWVEGSALDWETLPARVEAVVAERIGRLPQSTRELLTAASVEGESFIAEVVAKVQAVGERETIRRMSEALDRQHRLVSAEGIRRLGDQRLSRYRFRHILFQKYLYGTLDPVQRVYLHERVGLVLEGIYATHEPAAVALQLARHFEQAGINDKAIHYLQKAGERAVQLSAYHEGLAHLNRGLALLMARSDSGDDTGQRATVEPSGWAEQELALQLALGLAWSGSKGYGQDMKQAYTRARELSQQLGKTSELCRVMGEFSIFYYVRSEHQRARRLAEEALSLAQQAGDPLLEMQDHAYLGFALFALGEYSAARAHLAQTIDAYDPEQHHRTLVSLRGSDLGLSALAYDACCLWCLGYPEQAARRSQRALTLARRLGHLFSLVDVLCFAGCLFNAMQRDVDAFRDHAVEMQRLTSAKLMGWLGQAIRSAGEARAMTGQLEEGIALMQEGMALQRAGAEKCYQSGTLGVLAEAQAKAGRPEEGLATLDHALAWVEQTEERHWEAELHRLKGELLVMQGEKAEAEASLLRAIEVARRQQAKSWELRVTVSLARLWRDQGKVHQARPMLAAIYGWFTEGLDTPDLQVAKSLLDELG